MISVVGRTFAAERPNVLIIMADDCTHSDLPLYGGQNARTPNIDALAKQGMTFNRAYLCEAMCQPCRAELYSGLYPMRNGCAWNHSSSRKAVKSIPHYLRPLGYRVGLAGKVHAAPKSVFSFERVSGFDANCVRNPTRPHQLQRIRRFMTRDRDAPFCLVIALVEPHLVLQTLSPNAQGSRGGDGQVAFTPRSGVPHFLSLGYSVTLPVAAHSTERTIRVRQVGFLIAL